MSTLISDFAVQNWTITPVAAAAGQSAPATIQDQVFQLVLSGVVIANQLGGSDGNWGYNTLTFLPDVTAPIFWAIDVYGIPQPTISSVPSFSVQSAAPLVTLNSIFDQSTAVNAGFAVDSFQPSAYVTGTDATTNAEIDNIFNGIDVDVAVRDTDAVLYRMGYTITLIGTIVFSIETIQ